MIEERVQITYLVGDNIILDYKFEYGDIIYPKIGEEVVINADKRYKVVNVRHYIDGDGYTIYIVACRKGSINIMYNLYLSYDPEITMITNEKEAEKLAKGIVTFNDEKTARKYALNNDNILSGLPYYICFHDNKMVFIS